ncbi:biotin attachment protein, partial [Micromonospora chalcea]
MLAVLSPGQGSQKPGFLAPWLDLDGVEARLRWWSALAGVDLIHLGTRADADEIKDTARTQPLLVAAALLAAEHLPMHDVALVAGHSVG